MSRKTKAIKKMISSKGLSEMFTQMTGNADKSIIVPKIVQVRHHARHIYTILRKFACNGSMMRKIANNHHLIEIMNYTDKLKESIIFSKEIKESEEAYKSYDTKVTNAIYSSLKKNTAIRGLVVLCGKLITHKKHLEEKNNLSDKFILNAPSGPLMLFGFSSLDFAGFWRKKKCTALVKKFTLICLHYIYVSSYKIYDLINSPDVDIDQFSCHILDALGQVKKQIPRCEIAFKRIEDSVATLKKNFNSYYKTSIEAHNTSLIIESFVLDVSKEGKSSTALKYQFQTIVKHLRKMSSQKSSKDPAIKKLFDTLNNNFTSLDYNESELSEESKKSPDESKDKSQIES